MSADAIPTVGPTASPKAVREAKKRERFTRRQELDDVRALVTTQAGQRFLRRLLAKCAVFTQVEIENTNRVLVNEGKRSIGLWTITELAAADPKSLNAILFDNKDTETS